MKVTQSDLPPLVSAGLIDAPALAVLREKLRPGQAWRHWAFNALLALGVGQILAGHIFFFAYNWNDLPAVWKFGIVQGGLVVSVLLWIVFRLDKAASAFGIAATVLTGVMFAVFGQVYQTPAMVYTPFMLWAALSLPFALASRSHAHWAVWIAILCVAVTSWINTGLRPIHGDLPAMLAHLGLSVGLLGGLLVYDRLWRAGQAWFALVLLVAGLGFGVAAFTETFWSDDGFVFIALFSVASMAAFFAYVYSLAPKISWLCLITFAGACVAAQLIFKVLELDDDIVGIAFVFFIWFAGLTAGLGLAFRHFVRRFKTSKPASDTPEEPMHIPANETPWEGLGLDRLDLSDAQRSALIARDRAEDTPWYAEVLLAFGGVISALFALIFFGSFLALIVGTENGYVVLLLSAVILVGAMLARRNLSNIFVRHFFNTLILAGIGLAAAGLGLITESVDLTVAVIACLGVAIVILLPDRIMEFLLTLITAGCFMVLIHDAELAFSLIVFTALFTAAGSFLITQPVRGRLYHVAGCAFLLATPVLSIFNRMAEGRDGVGFGFHHWEQGVCALIVLAGVYYLNRCAGRKSWRNLRPPLLVLVPLIIAAALLPIGSTTALFVILVGYILGHRPMAIMGVLLQIYFLFLFYFDLQLTLLEKSAALVVSGLIFVLIWALTRRVEVRA